MGWAERLLCEFAGGEGRCPADLAPARTLLEPPLRLHSAD